MCILSLLLQPQVALCILQPALVQGSEGLLLLVPPFYSVLLGDRVPVAFNVLVQGGVRVSIGLLERNVVQAKFLGRLAI